MNKNLTEEQRIEELQKLVGNIEAAKRWASNQLGDRQFVDVKDNPTCGYAQFVTDSCRNVNIEEDGYCQWCDSHHFIKMFGREVGQPHGKRVPDGGWKAMMPNDIGGKFPMNLGLVFAGTQSLADHGEDSDHGFDYDVDLDENGEYIPKSNRPVEPQKSRAEKAAITRAKNKEARANLARQKREHRLAVGLDMDDETELSRKIMQDLALDL